MTPPPATGEPTFVVPLRLIFRVHQWGEHWDWRCSVAGSRLDPGYVDGACQYDHTVDSWEQLVADTAAHLALWHDVPAGQTPSSPSERTTPR